MKKLTAPTEPSLREQLAAAGIPSSSDVYRQRYHRHMAQILESRRAMESTLGLAMVTSAIPGIEVRFLE